MLLFFCKPVIAKHQIPISIVNIITYDLTDNIRNCYSTVTDKIQFQMGVGQKQLKVPIVKKSSSYCWAINEQ
jgi:hypothetical protein